jgi:hypothetical protein
MPSLIIEYNTGDKQKKGKMIDEVIAVLHMKYPTARRKILDGAFSYPEKKLLSDHRGVEIEDLFPETSNIE